MNSNSFLSRLPPSPDPPRPDAGCALFLDLDGTLLDIAPAPDRVVVPPDLIGDLSNAIAALGGAVAIVSGRNLCDIDGLVAPLVLPVGAEHGAEIRLPNGQRNVLDVRVPPEWIERVERESSSRAGVQIERKSHGIVLHYRRAAQHEDFCVELCAALASQQRADFEVLRAKMAVEIRAIAATKGRAVDLLMREKPFYGRRPVFVGDDITDEDGFREAERQGGEGLDVFQRFGGRPREVRRWLKSFADLRSAK